MGESSRRHSKLRRTTKVTDGTLGPLSFPILNVLNISLVIQLRHI